MLTNDSLKAKCKSCGADILWIKTKAGKQAPVEAEPLWIRKADGNEPRNAYLQLDGTLVSGVPVGDAYEGEATEVYTSHFANCPAVNYWRKGRYK